jgi:DMSO/TMAO reductase YedYZ molybdopterin-dependent catalytic subunit
VSEGESVTPVLGPDNPPKGVPRRRLPPGQYVPRGWPVLHYGRVPNPELASWDLRIFGATADGSERRLRYPEVLSLPQSEVLADFHCVTKFSMLDNLWRGVRALDLAQACPPHESVTHVMIWAEYGYSANVALTDFLADGSIFANGRNGEDLSPEHGWPLRYICPHLYAWKSAKWVRAVEYLVGDRRGFWEDRGYHNKGRAWDEQRYSYQERAGDGPPL